MIVPFLLLSVFSPLANPQQPAGKIVGGVQADIKDFPSYAALILIEPKRLKLICGGTYIKDIWVLTAAHCLLGPNVVYKLLEPNKLLVRMGMSMINETHQEQPPKKLFIHPYYPQSAKTTNDVGLIKLSTRFILEEGVGIATIVNTSRFSDQLVVVGFGNVNPNNSKDLSPSLHLQKVDVVAREIYKGYIECSDPTPRGTCFGDSGGPLFVRDSGMLVGIVATGQCAKGYTLYVNVFAYRKWINDTISAAFPIDGDCRFCMVYPLVLNRLIASLMNRV